MAESVAKMQTQHGLAPDFALIDGPYAPPALKQNPHMEVKHLALTMAMTLNRIH